MLYFLPRRWTGHRHQKRQARRSQNCFPRKILPRQKVPQKRWVELKIAGVRLLVYLEYSQPPRRRGVKM
jgi:hypothetical protein